MSENLLGRDMEEVGLAEVYEQSCAGLQPPDLFRER
jgi:hypothetical protein